LFVLDNFLFQHTPPRVVGAAFVLWRFFAGALRRRK